MLRKKMVRRLEERNCRLLSVHRHPQTRKKCHASHYVYLDCFVYALSCTNIHDDNDDTSEEAVERGDNQWMFPTFSQSIVKFNNFHRLFAPKMLLTLTKLQIPLYYFILCSQKENKLVTV